MTPKNLTVSKVLFKPAAHTWDLHTIQSLIDWIRSLPLQLPKTLKMIEGEGRLLGEMGTILLLIFLVAVLYSVVWRKQILQALEKELQPLLKRAPAETYPRLLALLRVLISPLLPLLFLGLFLLIQSFVHYESAWFSLITKLLALWAGEALILGFLREYLTDGLLPYCPVQGKTLLRSISLVLVYIGACLVVVWVVEASRAPRDVQALLRSAFSLTAVCFISLLFFRKQAFLSLLPHLPYRGYEAFTRFLERTYPGLALLTFTTGLLWALGNTRLSAAILIRTWGVAAAYVSIMLAYHFVFERLQRWSKKKFHADDEAAQFFIKSAKAVLKYGTFVVAALLILDLLGLLSPLHYVASLPILTIMSTPISVMALIEAGITLFAFIYVSKLLQVYLDYKVYPSMGVDTGLAYAINTFIRYLLLVAGGSFALRIAGLDLRVLMVFAGGLGIGAGLGLQNIASNIVSGFILVFGRKLRKGDWIRVEDKLGRVTHIYLRATKVWTRDNIEFIVPNSDLVSKQIVNYTLTSPIIRLHIPVGVSYDAAPAQVRKILMECAEKHPIVTQFRKPEVRIVQFGDNSVNYALLVWVDISQVAEGDIRSRLYYTIFDALGEVGIKLPYPQRDIHFDAPAVLQAVLSAEDKGEPGSGR